MQGLKDQLEIKNRDFEGLNERLKRTERKYEEAIIEDMVGRLRRELNETRNARNIAEALLATQQKELVDAMETLRLSEGEPGRPNVTLVVEERPQSSVSWTLFMGRRGKT